MAFPKAAVKLTGKATQRELAGLFFGLWNGWSVLYPSGQPRRPLSRFQPKIVAYAASGFTWDDLDPALPAFAKGLRPLAMDINYFIT